MASTSIDTFEVQLEELKRVFYPGDSVCGRVILKLREDLKIKEMRLECRGEAYVNWPEYSGSYTRYHYNKERYFNAMAVVFGGGKPNKNGVSSPACISQGSHSFSFQFVIPDKYLPASFEGRHGNIRYWARAVIDRGLGKSKMKTKPAQFFIGDYVALDDFKNVSEAVIEQDSRETRWPCLGSGKLELRAETERSGFKQGEDINLNLLVTNETSRDVICTEVSLVQRTVFVDIEGEKTLSDQPICCVTKEGVFSGWEHEYRKISLTIPQQTYPTLISCKCIAVLYFLLVRARLRGRFSKDGYLEIPVIVACSDADHSVNQVQQNDHALLTHGRQRRTKGTFFCLTTGTNFSRGDLGNSNYELQDQEEVDGFIKSLVLRTNRTRKDNFERHNSDSSSSLSNSVFTPRRQSDTSFFVNNGQFKKISMV
ncbi:arrestin domain-containing protein 3-like isoform X1 [Acropora muricata]|uniref:arrestin domain-containing protein 3-like isoform X1 n=1 Tax=Acropora muricata TaxID=159855 RepID=UPI0034E610CF